MIFSFCGCQKEDVSADKDDRSAVNVKVENVKAESIADVITYTGEVKASQSVSVSSKVSATANEVPVEVGDYVNEGDVLLILDDTDYRLQYDRAVNTYNQALIVCNQAENALAQAEAAVGQAEANYASAVSTYNSVVNGTAQQTTLQLKAALDAAKIEYDNAQINYENQKILYENGAISKSAFDMAVTRFDNAKLNYDTAKQNYDLAVNVLLAENEEKAKAAVTAAQQSVNSAKAGVESVKSNVELAKTDVENAQIQVDSAKNALDNTVIKAPNSGYIAAKNTNRGQMVAQGIEIFSIKETDIINVEINVTEAIISGLMVGSEAVVFVDAVSNEKFTGFISNINPTKDARTGMYNVTVQIDGINEVLKDGMFADVEITLAEAVETTVIPSDALLENSDGTKYVYIAKGDKAKKVDVVTGIITNDSVEIISGVSVGDEVIVTGKEYLSDKNTDIKIVK